jgi:hypothetical protein
MLNFKDGTKKKMLKVKYFKHPNIVGHLYNRFLVAYGKFSWNDDVPHYFARHFYADFSCTCTLIILVYRPIIMGLVNDEHMIAKGHIEM